MNLINKFLKENPEVKKYFNEDQLEYLEKTFNIWMNQRMKTFSFCAEFMIEYLAKNHHPHTKCIIDSTSSELLEGQESYHTHKFLVN